MTSGKEDVQKETKINRNVLLRWVTLKSCYHYTLVGCRSEKNMGWYVLWFLLKKIVYSHSKIAHIKTHLYFYVSLAYIFSRELKEGRSKGLYLLICIHWMNCCAKSKFVYVFLYACETYVAVNNHLGIFSWCSIMCSAVLTVRKKK